MQGHYKVNFTNFFTGWIVAFHIVLGEEEDSSFRDIGSSVAKVLTMFSGELAFETTFKVNRKK